MSSGNERSDLSTVRVEEWMQTDVVTARPDLSVADLVEHLEEHRITGVPVVDTDGVVVGVVSASDVARAALEEDRGEGDEPRATPASDPAGRGRDSAGAYFRSGLGPGPDGVGWALPRDLPTTRLGARAVREIMTPATFSVRREATLPEAARFLVEAGIHRALVFDGSELAGIVTSIDILRAVAGAGSEA